MCALRARQHDMPYSLTPLSEHARECAAWLMREYASVRTGQAAPTLLDGIRVHAYGSLASLSHVASVTIEDAKTIRVSPWDASLVKAVEKAIADAQLGVSVSVDDTGIRVGFPELTHERRTALLRLVGAKLEEARVRMRHERDRVWSDIQKKERDGEISEDEKFHAKDEMERLMQESNNVLQELARRKEQELLG